VSEVAVVGIDDPEWGQRVVAVVVASSPIESDELRDWLKTRLAPHKVPKEIHFADALPRNPMGKTIKPEVVEMVGSLA
jgi:acyl-CoA synthetase (AMP-forming)/AMP-acid ligase II